MKIKLGYALDPAQSERHIQSVASRPQRSGHSLLLGITAEPMSIVDSNTMRAADTPSGVLFAAVTFPQILEELRLQRADFEVELTNMVTDKGHKLI